MCCLFGIIDNSDNLTRKQRLASCPLSWLTTGCCTTMDRKETGYHQVLLRCANSILQTINDHSPKRILTLDEDPEADYDGIRRINAPKWLVGSAA